MVVTKEDSMFVKEVADRLGTTDKRIRNYSEHLEDLGYRFKRRANTQYRVYTEKDVDIISRAMYLQEHHKMSIALACQTVLNNADKEVDSEGEAVLTPALTNKELYDEMRQALGNIVTRDDLQELYGLVETLAKRDTQQQEIIKSQAALIEEIRKQQLLIEEKRTVTLKDKDEIISKQNETIEQMRIEREKDKVVQDNIQKQFEETMKIYKETANDNKRYQEIFEEVKQHFDNENPPEKKKRFFGLF